MDEDKVIINEVEQDLNIVEQRLEVAAGNDGQLELENEDNLTIVESIDVFEVGSEEAFPALGEPNEQLRHGLLNDRDLPDQHTIGSITGLRAELDQIEELGIVYSNEKGIANYYLWEDLNPLGENRIGFFVSICDDESKVKICTNGDAYGVTVLKSAFIGGQDDVARDDQYALIMHSGVASVRCESDVKAGDFVRPNCYGVAEKTSIEYGYKVISISDIDRITYAVINLDMSIDQICNMATSIGDIEGRMDKAETNIVTAINVANSVDNKLANMNLRIDWVEEKAEDAVSKADSAEQAVSDLENELISAKQDIVIARSIADGAIATAEDIRINAVNVANDAMTSVNALIQAIEPITEWEDGENSGAEYFVRHIENDLATKTEVQTVETTTGNAMAAISKNAKELYSLVSNVQKYSVGEKSQADGLTAEQAHEILANGIVYVPTVDHTEDSYLDTPQFFTVGWYYTWDSSLSLWIGSESPLVNHSSVYVEGNESAPYWYTTGTEDIMHDGNVYTGQTLYHWVDGAWFSVATLKGNVNNRAVSQIRQTQNEISVEIINARGSTASLNARLTDDESAIQSLVSWSQDDNGVAYNLATIKQTADDAGSSISLVVTKTSDGKVINAGSIVNAINSQGESAVTISADKINLTGYVTVSDLGKDGTTEIHGDRIKTGTLSASKITTGTMSADLVRTGVLQSQNYSETNKTGTKVNLSDGSILTGSKNFSVDKDGNLVANSAKINGAVTATSGYIGGDTGFIINSTSITNGKTSYNETTNNGVYLGVDGIGLGKGNFYVTADGSLTAKSGKIGGWTIDGNKLSSGYNVQYEFNIDSSTSSPWISASSLGTTQFSVSKAGVLYARGADIAGKITATSGYIGGDTGFIINSTSITNGKTSYNETTNNGIYLGVDGIGLGKGKFYVTSGGSLTAASGQIGGWTIGDNKLSSIYNTQYEFNIDASTSSPWISASSFGTTRFSVSKEGTLYATGANISGKITATSGKIGKLEISTAGINYSPATAPSNKVVIEHREIGSPDSIYIDFAVAGTMNERAELEMKCPSDGLARAILSGRWYYIGNDGEEHNLIDLLESIRNA